MKRIAGIALLLAVALTAVADKKDTVEQLKARAETA
jgi:hypothetical protein